MSRWFRFYDDAVNDPKILRLSDNLFRIWIGLLCLASKNDGALPPIEDVCVVLRLKPSQVENAMQKLVIAGLIDHDGTNLAPHNWNGRQYKSDVSTDRVKRFRKRHETVSVTPPDTDTDTDTEQRSKKEGAIALRVVDPPKPRKRTGRPLPEGWKPSLASYAIAEQFGQNVSLVEGIFRDYLASSGKLYADHDAAFHNFIRNQNSFNRGSNNGIRPSENRGSIVNAADRAIANLEREIAADNETSSGVVLSLPAQRLR